MKSVALCTLILLAGSEGALAACPPGGVCSNSDVGINLPGLPVWNEVLPGGIDFSKYNNPDWNKNVLSPGVLPQPGGIFVVPDPNKRNVVDPWQYLVGYPKTTPTIYPTRAKLAGYICVTPQDTCYVALPEPQASGGLCGCVTKEKDVVEGALK